MPETRTRPAREAKRFLQLVRANLWFWTRMRDADDPMWEVLQEWNTLPDSVKIRRHNAACPQTCYGDGDETPPEYEKVHGRDEMP